MTTSVRFGTTAGGDAALAEPQPMARQARRRRSALLCVAVLLGRRTCCLGPIDVHERFPPKAPIDLTNAVKSKFPRSIDPARAGRRVRVYICTLCVCVLTCVPARPVVCLVVGSVAKDGLSAAAMCVERVPRCALHAAAFHAQKSARTFRGIRESRQ